MKKTIIILLAALLALSVFVACDQDSIVDDMFNGGSTPEEKTLYINADTTTLAGGKTYTISGDVINENRLSIDGTDPVTILLPAGKTLNVKKGITVAEGQTLIIDEDGTKGTEIGKLIAGGTETPVDAAGIGGGGGYQAGGKITINGGTVTAKGGESAAGIGGGYYAAGGTITINGGTVEAYGGSGAAGIGGGGVGTGGTISISGGTVTATGGEYGAGIGGGSSKEGGEITITGGKVTAIGGLSAAGIGGGTEVQDVGGGEVTIAGGIVTATGGSADDEWHHGPGAGIGGGYLGAGGTVTINGGAVTATGGSGNLEFPVAGTGIGAGNGSSVHGDLTIADDVIMMVSTNNTDWSVYDGSTRTQYMKVPEPIVLTSSTTAWTSGNIYTLGDEDVEIGSRITVSGSVGLILPDGRKLTASKGITVTGSNSLTINGGTGQNAGILEATGGDRAAGIGGGYQEVGGKVTINGGTVTANGGEGAAGIGGGWYGTTGGTVTINGGTVEAIGGSIDGSSGGAGIGGGYYGAGGTVTINNGTVTATGVSGGAGIGGGYYKGGGTVTITGGSVTANGGQNAYGIGRGYDGGSDGTLTLTGVTMQVKDSEEASWESYVEDVRHRYMKADEGI